MLHQDYYLQEMQNKRFEIFKSQDVEKGHFDVAFEIEGKKLHAHKFILTSVSETMDSWLSNRWTKKDESAIKIETCTYENFYQFLHFLYSGDCEINDVNVFQMVDMAEFFAVSYLKKFCADFLLKMRLTTENVEKVFEIADKYSLPKLRSYIHDFIQYGESGIYDIQNFIACKKPFIEFLSTLDWDSDYLTKSNPTILNKSEFFEWVYEWAEHQVLKEEPVDVDGTFNLEKAIKIKLESILPNIKFSQMNRKFLLNFVVEKGFLLSPAEIREFYISYRNSRYHFNEENVLKAVYELAQKQALKKQMMAEDDEIFNVTDSIRADFVEVIPFIEFKKMSQIFLMNFVVANGILTKEQASHVHVYEVLVGVSNYSKSIAGVFEDRIGLYEVTQNVFFYAESCSSTKIRFNQKIKFPVPSTPSCVTKMKGVEWYLCLEKDGDLTFKHYSRIDRSDYLLAEMKSEVQFKLVPNEVTFLTAARRKMI